MTVDGFLDGTAHSGRGPFHCTVTPLRYSVPGWSICATKPQVNFRAKALNSLLQKAGSLSECNS